MKSKPNPPRTVAAIHRRDGTCHLCWQLVEPEEATRDHLVTRTTGGRDRADNYLLAHRDCNGARGELPLDRAHAAAERVRAAGFISRGRVIAALREELARYRSGQTGGWV